MTIQYGLPETIVSDQYVKFTSTFWCELHCMLEAKLLMSTVFHPQTDGASERTIRNMVQILQAIVQSDQKDWVVKLPMTEFTLNSSISSSTGFAPFKLNCSMLQTHINFPRFLPIFPDFLEQLSHLAPIY
jgi:hypothetical protein